MYRTLLGADGFRKGMDLYFSRHDGQVHFDGEWRREAFFLATHCSQAQGLTCGWPQAVTCDDFRAAMADANGKDLGQFERWYLQASLLRIASTHERQLVTPTRVLQRSLAAPQAGTPTVKAEGEYDSNEKRYKLVLSQSTPATPGQPTKLPFHIPVETGLLAQERLAREGREEKLWRRESSGVRREGAIKGGKLSQGGREK